MCMLAVGVATGENSEEQKIVRLVFGGMEKLMIGIEIVAQAEGEGTRSVVLLLVPRVHSVSSYVVIAQTVWIDHQR